MKKCSPIETRQNLDAVNESWKATIDISKMLKIKGAGSSIDIEPGYGCTEKEAIDNLKNNIRLAWQIMCSVVADELMKEVSE